jgi:hypothetical protein
VLVKHHERSRDKRSQFMLDDWNPRHRRYVNTWAVLLGVGHAKPGDGETLTPIGRGWLASMELFRAAEVSTTRVCAR